MNVEDLLVGCRFDLQRIREEARWAYQVGYGKAGRGLTAERGVSLAKPQGGDQVDGPVYDLEVGDHGCRLAFQNAAARLAITEHLLDDAVRSVGITDLPKLVRPHANARIGQVEACIKALDWRLDRIDGHDSRPTRAKLAKAYEQLGHAASGLARAFAKGYRPTVSEFPNCVICEIRPAAVAFRRRKGEMKLVTTKGGRCDTCWQWKVRHEGKERPKSIDERAVKDARAAAARRAERSEGWGAA